MSDVEKCLMCGEDIPEGRQICPTCEERIIKEKEKTDTIYSNYIYRGDVFFADLNPVVGSEIGGYRPVVILQNDIGNRFSTTVIAAATSRSKTAPLPTHVRLGTDDGGLTGYTTILLEQIRTLDKRRLRQFVGHLSDENIQRINKAAAISIGLDMFITDDGGMEHEI